MNPYGCYGLPRCLCSCLGPSLCPPGAANPGHLPLSCNPISNWGNRDLLRCKQRFAPCYPAQSIRNKLLMVEGVDGGSWKVAPGVALLLHRPLSNIIELQKFGLVFVLGVMHSGSWIIKSSPRITNYYINQVKSSQIYCQMWVHTWYTAQFL